MKDKSFYYNDKLVMIEQYSASNLDYDIFFYRNKRESGYWLWVKYKFPKAVINRTIKEIKKFKDFNKFIPTIMRLTALKETL